jgi:hypothetical protein
LRYAYTCANAVLLNADLNGTFDSLNQGTRSLARSVRVRGRQTQSKFVVSDARENLGRGDQIAYARAKLQERLIASDVSIDFIQFLVLIETQQQHAHFVAGALQRRAYIGLELAPVGQLGQWIPRRDGLQPAFHRQAFCSLASLIGDTAQAEYDQRYAKEI